MICLKIRTFVVLATTAIPAVSERVGCDLLENSYLCGISNNRMLGKYQSKEVVICLKIRTFVVLATTYYNNGQYTLSCDLLENSYLCGISNNMRESCSALSKVVICLKIRTFVVLATT